MFSSTGGFTPEIEIGPGTKVGVNSNGSMGNRILSSVCLPRGNVLPLLCNENS
jgi:hypothetical protein